MADLDPAQEEHARLDALFAALTDSGEPLEPIDSAEYAARRARCRALLTKAGCDALWLEGGATMRYLTGLDWKLSERMLALVVVASGEPFWICPAFEVERVSTATSGPDGCGGDVIGWQEHEHPFVPLADALRARGIERLGVDSALRHFLVAGLARHWPSGDLMLAAEIITELRGCKSPHEQALLRRANELTQQAIGAVNQHLRPGMTGAQIGRMMVAAQQRLGLKNIWVLPLIGPAAALPHGSADQRPLADGEVLLVDTGGSLHGYQSDNTRSWVPFGQVPDEVSKVWQVVRDAQRAAFDALRPGVRCGDIDRAARAIIGSAGYGHDYQSFTHRLGHGIGTEGHESPYLDGGSEVLLQPGMTFSDEPGIYLPGRFGLRIEDIVQVTADGADHYGQWQAGPASPEPA